MGGGIGVGIWVLGRGCTTNERTTEHGYLAFHNSNNRINDLPGLVKPLDTQARNDMARYGIVYTFAFPTLHPHHSRVFGV